MNEQSTPLLPSDFESPITNLELRITGHILSLKDRLRNVINARSEVLFAYLHGSSLSSENPRDIDVAIYLTDTEYAWLHRSAALILDYQMPLEMFLGNAFNAPVDIQVLNAAPLGFRYRVAAQGLLLCDHDPQRREEFELLSRKEYFDFRPRVMQYLSETTS